jgi:hypothetical protein
MDLRPLAVELWLGHVQGVFQPSRIPENLGEHRRNELHGSRYIVPCQATQSEPEVTHGSMATAMMTPVSATEWLGPAPRGATKPQIFRLQNGIKVILKHPETSQGPLAVANDFICCRLAERLELPVNRVLLVEVSPSLKPRGPVPAGIHAGFVYCESATPFSVSEIATSANREEWEQLRVFEQLVRRDDKDEVLIYEQAGKRYFFAIDYGFTFGGTPAWTSSTLATLGEPQLPFEGARLRPMQAPLIARLRTLSPDIVASCIHDMDPSRFGLDTEQARLLPEVLAERAAFLVHEYDRLQYP